MSIPSPERSRRIARTAGVLFIITFVSSIAALVLYDPVLNHTNYVLGAGADTRVSLGALCEIVLAIANIGTAVVLFPILRHQDEGIALGYVASRTLESTIILVGVVSLLAVVTLRQDLAGATGTDAATLTTTGRALVAVHDATFLLGPAFCAGFGTGLLLGYLMYKSGLVPRRMAMIGLYGGPIAFASATAVLLGAYDQQSAISFLFTIPEIVWEASLGIYLTFKGFKKAAPLLNGGDAPRTVPEPVPLVAVAAAP